MFCMDCNFFNFEESQLLNYPQKMFVTIFTYRKHQQFILAKWCEEVFGDMLLKEPLTETPVSQSSFCTYCAKLY